MHALLTGHQAFKIILDTFSFQEKLYQKNRGFRLLFR